jgi:hypothetical protein
MTRFFGLVLAGGLILGAAGKAEAQVAVSIGNPWYGRGVYVGAGMPAYVAPGPIVAGPVFAPPPVVGLGIGVYPRGPIYRPYPYYGPRPYGPYRRW